MPLLIMYLCNLRIEYLVRNESDQGLTVQSVTKPVPSRKKNSRMAVRVMQFRNNDPASARIDPSAVRQIGNIYLLQRYQRPITRRELPIVGQHHFDKLLAVDQAQLGAVAFQFNGAATV